MAYCEINVINIGSAGDLVFTERVDTMFRGDGSKIVDFPVFSRYVTAGFADAPTTWTASVPQLTAVAGSGKGPPGRRRLN